jgi:hypothetical protein
MLAIVGSIILYYFSRQLVGIVLFVIGILSFILQFKKPENHNNEELERLGNLYDRNIEKMQAEFGSKEEKMVLEKRKTEKELKKIKKHASGMERIVSRINETLKKEHISKEELIMKIDSPQFILMLQKYNEPPKEIQNRLLKSGFKTFGYGIYILPPVRARELGISADLDIDKWVDNNVLTGLPNDYKYIINFAAVIDLRHMTAKRKMVVRPKTYLDILEPEDLVNPDEIASYLKNKKNISLKDIIQIPNFAFLIDEFSIDKEDYNALKMHNDKILTDIKKKIGNGEIKTTDLSTIAETTLNEVLKNYVKNPEIISKMIIKNAKFWSMNLR